MSSVLFLNLTTAYASRLNTTTNMTPVTPSTNRDSPWIAWAGVETGAKMFVGLSGEGVDCADAVAGSKHRPSRTKGATRMREWCECVVCMSLVDGATWLPNGSISGIPRPPQSTNGLWPFHSAGIWQYTCEPPPTPAPHRTSTSSRNSIRLDSVHFGLGLPGELADVPARVRNILVVPALP